MNSPSQMPMRHSIKGHIIPKGSTPRRLSAARRALKRERERYPLLVEQLHQETPAERIERSDEELVKHDQARRDLAAAHWRQGRRNLAAVEASTQSAIERLWNASTCPPEAHYFVDFIRTQFRKRGLPLLEDEPTAGGVPPPVSPRDDQLRRR